ncbi:MAG: hypothetical protein WC313_08035 [Candidatus Kapaibacterium sp.]|nr:hypothetical protein [Candidatus Kapabacteria bacterium]
MKYFYSLLLCVLFSNINLLSQTDWNFTPYGYVKADVYYDTRQTIDARDGLVLLYPAPQHELSGEDANASSQFTILAIQSRFGYKIKAPEFLGAKMTGLLEGEFFGAANSDIGSVRLRQANLTFDWGQHSLKAGHDWHPMFIAEAYAQTISFNTGIPFVPFSRTPLLTYTFKSDNFKALLSAISEMEFPSTGPLGSSTEYRRNSGIPMVNLGLRFESGNWLFAANALYNEIMPRLTSQTGHIDRTTVGAYSANILARYKSGDFFITASTFVGQNTHNFLMTGGYAVKSTDSVTGKWDYSPINISSSWIDLQYGNEFTIGLFGGFQKNLGSETELTGPYFARGNDIDYIYRMSPRISYKTGKTQIAAEFEYTAAAYGTNDSFGRVNDANEVGNLRILLAAFIYF